jgi:hypothetical protein
MLYSANYMCHAVVSNFIPDEGVCVFGLAGQSPVVEDNWSETSLNGVGQSTSDAVEGEP